ncbi:MAG: phytoene desaturase [Rhizobiaceae bacterium]|nr:phytoene desaturase [Rhizobiaceae bacterium]
MNTHFTLDQSVVATSGDNKPHVVVIGAGFGGLAAGLRLLARGYRVTIAEKLEQAGGRASVFRQNGFVFDAGPTIVTAPFVFEELWELFGKEMADYVTLKPLDPFYRIRFDDGDVFTCNGDADFMRSEIERFNPDDVKGYEQFLIESEANYKIGFEMMGMEPFSHVTDMLRFLPQLISHRADRSVYAHVAKHISHEKLRIALSFHPLFVGGNPLRVTSIYSLIAYLERNWGVHYVMGGTGALVAGMVKLFKEQGGSLLLNSPVSQVVTEHGKAKGIVLEGGREVGSEIVVSNADAAWGYANLLGNAEPKRWKQQKLNRINFSMSLFVWYFGTDKKFENVDHHTILMGPRYQGLLKDIFDKKVLAEDFSLYLHRPTANDPSVAPEGCDAFYVLAPVPHLEAGVDWHAAAEKFRQRIQTRLEETLMPGLANHIAASMIMTPNDFEQRLNAPFGAAFGPEPIFTQSAWFRPHNASEEIDGLYLVGAGTHPGAGLPGVVTSAKVLDRLIPHANDFAHSG